MMVYEVHLFVHFLKSVQSWAESYCHNYFPSYYLIDEILVDVDRKAQYVVLTKLLFKSMVASSTFAALPYIYFNKYILKII